MNYDAEFGRSFLKATMVEVRKQVRMLGLTTIKMAVVAWSFMAQTTSIFTVDTQICGSAEPLDGTHI